MNATKLMGYFRQLMGVNREFLGMTSVTKVPSLSTYINALSRNLADCEKWIYGAGSKHQGVGFHGLPGKILR